MDAGNLKDFINVNDKLYCQGGCGELSRAVSMTKAKEELEHLHELSCGDIDAAFRSFAMARVLLVYMVKEVIGLHSTCL